jgi:hypothetical protein
VLCHSLAPKSEAILLALSRRTACGTCE